MRKIVHCNVFNKCNNSFFFFFFFWGGGGGGMFIMSLLKCLEKNLYAEYFISLKRLRGNRITENFITER